MEQGCPPCPRSAQEDWPPCSHHKSPRSPFSAGAGFTPPLPGHHTHSHHNKVTELSTGEDGSWGNCRYFRGSRIKVEVALRPAESPACCGSESDAVQPQARPPPSLAPFRPRADGRFPPHTAAKLSRGGGRRHDEAPSRQQQLAGRGGAGAPPSPRSSGWVQTARW